MYPQPLIAVQNVEISSRWYQAVLGLKSAHGGDDYERLTFEGQLMLQLHRWDVHDHPNLGDAQSKPYGDGVLLWFQTDEFDVAVERIVALKVTILDQPKYNPNANHREIWLRDPDDYTVVLAGAYGDT